MGLEISICAGKLAQLGLTKQVAALLVGASGTDMTRWLNGVNNFPNLEFKKLSEMLDTLLKIREVIFPLALPLSDVSALKVLLERYRESGLDRIMERESLDGMRRQIEEIKAL